ncbi:tetratricopeptide repeat protein [Paracoccus contaminans]|uniref:Pilus assembly protein TadD n=1 Tax=Paracoccus contaminans TaxID=1945662 RepID=A0A1W6D002_9RHOB|nr:tetratricopeptide repeat protein [Paracoccus contaminans]ARJ70464.1 hypothetical protein B0A89_13265 [Paracoccus contaminans]
MSLVPVLSRLMPAMMLAALTSACNDPNFGVAETRQTTAVERVVELRRALKTNPADTAALSRLGDLYADQGMWAESMGAYREALILSPSDRNLVLGYGRGQLAVGDFGGALKTAAQAGDSDVRGMLLKAGALAGAGQLAQSRALLERARAIAPRDLDVRSNLSLVAALQRDPTAYGIARAAAFAPDADFSHIRNMVLVGGITGNDGSAAQDGERRGLDPSEIGGILSVGHRARTQGMSAVTVLTR